MNFPCTSDGQLLTATAAGISVALAGDAARVRAARDILFWNPGPELVRLRCGDAGVAAGAASAVIPPNALWIYAKGASTHVALQSAGADQQVLVIVGEGS